jgi:peptidoglycan hydrolase-like protein with peptidoglycan-binding domain
VLGLPPHELFDVTVEVTVREFQRRHQLVPDGIVGPKTWAALDAVAASAHVLAGE